MILHRYMTVCRHSHFLQNKDVFLSSISQDEQDICVYKGKKSFFYGFCMKDSRHCVPNVI